MGSHVKQGNVHGHGLFNIKQSSLVRSLLSTMVPEGGGGGCYFPVKGYWGCAAGGGRIFTTGLIILGLITFLVELLEWGRTFSENLG